MNHEQRDMKISNMSYDGHDIIIKLESGETIITRNCSSLSLSLQTERDFRRDMVFCGDRYSEIQDNFTENKKLSIEFDANTVEIEKRLVGNRMLGEGY